MAVAVVFVVLPSPKFQKRLVIVPVEPSVKVTVSGLTPLVGLAVKIAAGTTAPMPVIELLLLPALPLVKVTAFVKLLALEGVKLMTRLVEPEPGRLKGVPERIVNGPPLTVATPSLRGAPPRLVMVKLAWALEPTATVPKSRLAGSTASCAGVRPEPVTVLVLLPPLLVNTTTLLKLMALVGAKLTATKPVAPGARLKGVPLWIAKGKVVATAPVKVSPPLFTTWKFCALVWPSTTWPKFRLGGLRLSSGGTLVTTM